MKKIKILTMISIVLIAMIAFQSCEDDEDGPDEEKISKYNETESHETGSNCMNCHVSGGSGEGWFKVAGTVYDSLKVSPFPNTTVKLYDGPNGTGNLIETIEVDGLGNFFTTKNIEFGSGLYASVTGNLTTEHMNTQVTTGQCNGCHGVGTDKIWAK